MTLDKCDKDVVLTFHGTLPWIYPEKPDKDWCVWKIDSEKYYSLMLDPEAGCFTGLLFGKVMEARQ